ncbi:MAG: substrate-binding domain-containing protein [Opitutaceae bacterium]|nr:substrate-binding domain-containing protein [Opitutaceae bacterium]
MGLSATPLPFRRRSLIEQAAQALRAAVDSGTLTDPLPGEHTLAEQLGISRPTLRAALAMLAGEGWLKLARGRRTRLLRQSETHEPPPVQVCIVCPQSRQQIVPGEHPILQQLHARFAANGIAWEDIFEGRLAGARPEGRLRELTRQHPRACWLLLASTAPMQRWFAAVGLPCLVLGSCHADVRLPSLDLNYRAIGWHAGGTLLQHGHRHVAIVTPHSPLAGDLACRAALRDALAKAAPAANLTEVATGPAPRDLRTKLDRLLALPNRPTAIFCLLPAQSLAVLLHLLDRGWRIPGDLTLLARDLPPVLATVMPEFAHYSRPVDRLASRALRLAQDLLAGRSVPAKPGLITPEFRPGATLGAPRA